MTIYKYCHKYVTNNICINGNIRDMRGGRILNKYLLIVDDNDGILDILKTTNDSERRPATNV